MARTRTENISFRQWACVRGRLSSDATYESLFVPIDTSHSLNLRGCGVANPKDLASKDELESTQDCVLIESLFTVWIV